MRNLSLFQEIEKKNYIIWSDAGPHFRCGELIHYLFVELAEKNISISLNFFGERHGKNSRDQHFSLIQNFVNQESLVKKLTCSHDIVDAIERHQKIANQKLIRKKYGSINTNAFVVSREAGLDRNVRTIENLLIHYNFNNFNNEGIMRSSLFSDLEKNLNVPFTDSAFNAKKRKNQDQENYEEQEEEGEEELNEKKIEEVKVDAKNIAKKKRKIESLLGDDPSEFLLSSQQKMEAHEFLLNSKESLDFCNKHCKTLCNGTNKVKMKFTIDQLNNTLCHNEIIAELFKHGHPKSRKINGINRNKDQSIAELKIHYLNHHLN
jgi:hypothetical protein